MSLKKDLHQLVQEAEDAGFVVSYTPNGHLRFDSPLPGVQPTFGPSTPSEHRGLYNLRAKLRRRGLPRNKDVSRGQAA